MANAKTASKAGYTVGWRGGGWGVSFCICDFVEGLAVQDAFCASRFRLMLLEGSLKVSTVWALYTHHKLLHCVEPTWRNLDPKGLSWESAYRYRASGIC